MKKKTPRDIQESLKRKTGRLQSYIILESLEQLSEASKGYEKLLAEAKQKGDVQEHPLQFYTNGKELMYKMQWYDAKQEFIKYERRLETKDSRCRKPEDDNCYLYLSYCEEQLRMQNITPETNPILSQNPYASVVPDERKNKYEIKYREWIAKHKRSDSALMSSAGLTRPFSGSGSSKSSTSAGLLSPDPHKR